MQSKTLTTQEGKIFYRTWRSIKPNSSWLIFLPGLAATWRLFEKQIDYFSDKVNVLVWDAPSHGESCDYPLTWSIDSLANNLHEILEAEAIENPIIIGQSMGGLVAQAYAYNGKKSPAAIISVDSFPLTCSYYKSSDIFFLKHAGFILTVIPWSMLLEGSALANSMTEYGRQVMREMIEPYGKQRYVALVDHGFREVAKALEKSRADILPCPLLIICGKEDSTGSVKKFNSEWEKREAKQVVWIPFAMHNSTSDNPDAINFAIEKFLITESLLPPTNSSAQ